MRKDFVVGYDPGGNGAHGVAVLQVVEQAAVWIPNSIQVQTTETLRDAVRWILDACGDGKIVAAGLDTLTEWSSGKGGWRSADLWLREQYPQVRKSVVSPNSIYGSMAINGAAFLSILSQRFEMDGTMVTEAHPKVCYFALVHTNADWPTCGQEMATWRTNQFEAEGVRVPHCTEDHCFDAALSALAALRGLNREWTLDLHALGEPQDTRVKFGGTSHYWWPGEEATSAIGGTHEESNVEGREQRQK